MARRARTPKPHLLTIAVESNLMERTSSPQPHAAPGASARLSRVWLLLAFLLVTTGYGPCGFESVRFRFLAPQFEQLSAPGDVTVELLLHPRAVPGSLTLKLDGAPVDLGGFSEAGGRLTGVLGDPGVGEHLLEATVTVRRWFWRRHLRAWAPLVIAEFDRPESCEVLNDEECILPFPSSRFLEAADTATGYRVAFPDDGLPTIAARGNPLGLLTGVRYPLSPEPFRRNDGFSPMVQAIMHFPGGVDLVASDASRLLPETRNFGTRSLDWDSPSVLIDADSGERILHFLENDIRAEGSARQATFLRPNASLLPGHRYIVAVRKLVAPDGMPVEPEPAFRALRDRRAITIPSIAARRAEFEDLFHRLKRAGVPRHDLILAFDFMVASDASLAGDMLAMRSDALEWLDEQPDWSALIHLANEEILTSPRECRAGDLWKYVSGTFTVPVYLETDGAVPVPADPYAAKDTLGFIARDEDGVPVRTSTAEAPFGLVIPCRALGQVAQRPMIFGHGLFGSHETVRGATESVFAALARSKQLGLVADDVHFDFVTAATPFSGLSRNEVPPIPSSLPDDLLDILDDPVLAAQIFELLQSFIGRLLLDFDRFDAMPDRLQQGQVAQVLLTRLMVSGAFGELPAVQLEDGTPLLVPREAGNYIGGSLGGIMGFMLAALTPDIERFQLDVPGVNFSFMLQRAKPFQGLDTFLSLLEPDAMIQALGIGILHESWVRGEGAGYAHHVTGHTLPSYSGDKKLLILPARYDQQVNTLAAQMIAATVGAPNLDSSAEVDLPGLPDVGSSPDSAHVLYDTGALLPERDADAIPPLANLQATPSRCDPHGREVLIPAALLQSERFHRPGGDIVNFCNGVCDAAEPLELPNGGPPCVPD